MIAEFHSDSDGDINNMFQQSLLWDMSELTTFFRFGYLSMCTAWFWHPVLVCDIWIPQAVIWHGSVFQIIDSFVIFVQHSNGQKSFRPNSGFLPLNEHGKLNVWAWKNCARYYNLAFEHMVIGASIIFHCGIKFSLVHWSSGYGCRLQK